MNANDHRKAAAQQRSAADESFERCDTDGFVSQWAHAINAQVHDRQADIAAEGGVWAFQRTRLETLDGELVSDARVVRTRYGTKWRVDSTDAWLPYQPARETTLAKRGYREVSELEIAPAKAITWAPSGARGMSGATSVQVIIIRTDRPERDGWQPCGAPSSFTGEAA
jgi:hypothetical protein